MATLISLENASREVRRGGSAPVQALDDVTLQIAAGERVAVVGESGSGKTTLLRVLLGLEKLTSGSYSFAGQPLTPLDTRAVRALRRQTGVVFQDPYTSFNPALKLGTTVLEPVTARRSATAETVTAATARAHELLTRFELPQDALERYPHEFSGGQRQRLALLRALIAGPQLLLGDEPVSALDAHTRAELVNLLDQVSRADSLTLVTVTHDLAVVPQLAERVVVLYRGRIVEDGPTAQVLSAPRDPYTASLLAARPRLQLPAA